MSLPIYECSKCRTRTCFSVGHYGGCLLREEPALLVGVSRVWSRIYRGTEFSYCVSCGFFRKTNLIFVPCWNEKLRPCMCLCVCHSCRGSDFSLSHAHDRLNPTSYVSIVHLDHLWPRGGKVASRLVCSSPGSNWAKLEPWLSPT